MRFLLTASGSRGDMQPLLALGVGLLRAGHDVLFGASPTFAQEIAAFGLRFAPVGRDQHELTRRFPEMGGASANSWTAFRVFNRVMEDEVKYQFEGLEPIGKGFDFIVSQGGQFAAKAVAELHGAQYRYCVNTPREYLRSREYSPGWVGSWSRYVPKVLNPMAWALMERSQAGVLVEINKGRTRLGLRPTGIVFGEVFHPDEALLALDPQWAELAPVKTRYPPTGYWLLPDERPLPEPLSAFLAGGERPVFIGFGSTADTKPEETTAIIRRSIDLAGCRAVIAADFSGLGDGAGNPRVFTVSGSLNHSRLFQQVSAVVQHGGAGTIAVAARAGAPVISIPHFFDQHGHAWDAFHVGISPRPIPRHELTAERLAGAIRACLTDPKILRRAREVQETLAAQNAVGEAIRQLLDSIGHPRPRN